MTDTAQLTFSFLRRHPQSAAQVLEAIDTASAADYLLSVPPNLAAPVLAAMPPQRSATVAKAAGTDFVLALLPRLPPNTAAAILRRLPLTQTENLLANCPNSTAFKLRLLLRYPITTVGAWMDPSAPVLTGDITIEQAWQRLRQEGGRLSERIYVIDREQQLLGQISSEALLTSGPSVAIGSLLEAAPTTLLARGELETALANPHWRESDPLPVLSREQHFLGVARFVDLFHAHAGVDQQPPESVFTDTLMDLLESYWSGLARVVEDPFTRTGRASTRNQQANTARPGATDRE